MIKIVNTIGAAAILTLVAQPALATTCADSLQSWQEEALKDGKLLSSISTGKRAAIYRQRTEKARAYADAKDEAACMNEVKMLSAMTAQEKASEAYRLPAGSVADTFRTSKPAAPMSGTTDEKMFVGRPVYDKSGAYLGSVDGTVTKDLRTRYLIVSRAGGIGIEDKEYFVPISTLRVREDGSAFMIGASAEELYKMPSSSSQDRDRMMKDVTFQTDLDGRYKSISAFGQ